MVETVVKRFEIRRRTLIFGAVIAAAVTFGLLYYFDHMYGITWSKVGWSLAFGVLLFATYYAKFRGEPATPKSNRAGVMTLESAVVAFVVFFVIIIPNSKEFVDTLLSELWPLVAGVSISWLTKSLYVLYLYEGR
jgi:predicted secreted protein